MNEHSGSWARKSAVSPARVVMFKKEKHRRCHEGHLRRLKIFLEGVGLFTKHKLGLERGNSDGETIDWGAPCGKTARAVLFSEGWHVQQKSVCRGKNQAPTTSCRWERHLAAGASWIG